VNEFSSGCVSAELSQCRGTDCFSSWLFKRQHSCDSTLSDSVRELILFLSLVDENKIESLAFCENSKSHFHRHQSQHLYNHVCIDSWHRMFCDGSQVLPAERV
jgi:hypothetical protein